MRTLIFAALALLAWSPRTAATARDAAPARNGPPAATVEPGAEVPADDYHDCLQKCLQEFKKNVRDCKRVCKTCKLEIFGICFSSTVDDDCFGYCKEAAQNVHEACKQGCVEA